jgi:spectinomycin phosphotransferase
MEIRDWRSRELIEKPDIKDEKIIAALEQNYSLRVSHLEFLPLGNDVSAFSYRVGAKNGDMYFLKIKTKLSNLAGQVVPRFLKDHGIEQVIAPISTNQQKLIFELDGFALILYPFIFGREAMQVGMSDSQWKEFGSTLRRIHDMNLPSDISQYVSRETFLPKWSGLSRELSKQVNTQNYEDQYQKELARFWKGNHETIETIIERAETIGVHLGQMHLDFVLCHADIHTANILITGEQDMFIVDWDDTLLAPKERDLMFVLGEDAYTREEQMFFSGYGNLEISRLALAYYRYEWCVQEIGDFGTRVFLTQELGENTKQDAVEGFMKLFSQGDVIEAALNTPIEYEIRNHA